MQERSFIQRQIDYVVDLIKTLLIIVPIAFVIRTWIYGLYQVPTGSMETTMLVGERFFADKFSYLFWPVQRGDIIAFNDPEYKYSDNYGKRLFEHYVWGPQNWTKRVIGIPGDHVEGKIEDGIPQVYVNGKKLDEPYLNKYPLIPIYQQDNKGAFTYESYSPDVSFEKQPFYRMNDLEVRLGKQIAQKFGEDAVRMPGTPRYDRNGRNVDIYDVKLGENEYWVMGDNRQGSYDARFWGGTGHPLNGDYIHGKIVFRIWSLDSNQSWWILDLLFHPIDFWNRIRWSRCMETIH
jgi:signal peptidase I